METPLITEASSSGAVDNGGDGDGDGYQRSKPYYRRSDAIAYGTRYQKAAALVDLAEDGIGLPEEVLNDITFERAAKFYFIYIRFDLLWSLNLFALILLNFLEKPLWCTRYGQYSCEERDFFLLGQLPYLTSMQSLTYEGITLLILVLHTFLPLAYEGCCLYWKSPLNKLKVILLIILVCDVLVYALYLSPVLVASLPFRVAPYIRVVFVTLSIRELRACMLTLTGMAGMYLNVLALWLLFLLFSSWLAYVTFEDTQQGRTMFYSYGATLYQMFVLFTTSNNPDVWIPAYKKSRWSCLLFVIYVLLGVYFLTNLILAVVYDSFKAQLAKQVVEMDSMRIRILGKAFSLIDNYKQGFLNKEQCICLFEELNKYRSLPKTSREDFELIFSELDDSGDFKLDIENSSAQKIWQQVEFFFVIGESLTFFFPSELPFLSNGEWIRYLLIARMLRLIRLLLHIRRYRAFVATFLTLIPSLMPYLGTIFCVLCIYCSLGVQLFGGIVNFGNPNLEATDLFADDYVLFNFNDYPNGMVTLFNLLVMGNWQVWMQSYRDLTGTSWTLVYFISFYLITVLLLLNLVVAFVLEAFFAEMELETTSGSEEDKDASRKDRRRCVGVKTRSRTVDILLHHMLSTELSQTQSCKA
uniref:Two pore calcium channel protein 1 isoform X5 n=1 Tax=Elaeis guineensis var. tenera TaxID=51953 RepID=A0A6I9RE82_ELAGV|nr:two pore calcium channel protein 1 isoform X5 [Elaeis guineensis]